MVNLHEPRENFNQRVPPGAVIVGPTFAQDPGDLRTGVRLVDMNDPAEIEKWFAAATGLSADEKAALRAQLAAPTAGHAAVEAQTQPRRNMVAAATEPGARTWMPVQLAAGNAGNSGRPSLAEIARILGHAAKSGAGYVCSCPCHDDQHASLKIDEKGGTILFHCYAGCDQVQLAEEFKRRGWLNGAAAPSPKRVTQTPRPSDYQANAPQRAKQLWEAAKPADSNHAYLVHKNVSPHGIREDENHKLVVPIRSADGDLVSLETIAEDGTKKFLAGSRYAGGFYVIGEIGAVVYVAEGFATGATIHQVTGEAVVVAFSCGNLSAVAQIFRAKYPAIRIVMAADDNFDKPRNVGILEARKAAQKASAVVAVPPFDRAAGETGKDWNDFAETRGHDAAKAAFNAALRAPIETQGNGLDKPKFPLVAWQDIAFDLDEEWSVEGVFPRVGLACLYGLPSSIKSFVLMDLFKCLAAGGQWGGREVKQGPVVYIAAEGQNGVKKRITGMKKVRKDLDLPNDLPFHLITRAPNFGTSEADRQDLIRDIEAMNVRPIAIGIDTLAQSLGGGDENGTGMVQLIANAGVLIEHFQCLVFLIHHVPIADAERLRGKTDLSGALDVAVLAQRTKGALLTTLTIKKSKDENQELSFTVALVRVVIGTSRSGNEVSTLVVESVTEAAGTGAKSPAQQKRIPQQMNMLVSVVQQAIAETEAALIRPFANGPLSQSREGSGCAPPLLLAHRRNRRRRTRRRKSKAAGRPAAESLQQCRQGSAGARNPHGLQSRWRPLSLVEGGA